MHIYSFSRRKIAGLMDRLRVLQQGMRLLLRQSRMRGCHRLTERYLIAKMGRH